MYFFISCETSSLTHVLFGSMLFTFQVFRDFSVLFLFDFIVSGNHAPYDFNSFKFVEFFVCLFLFCFCPGCDPAWYIFHGHLKRNACSTVTG